MKKVAICYWSQTGNTEMMANAIAEGAKKAGADAILIGPSDLNVETLATYDVVAFGCPAMGDEVLEEDEFEPMFTSIETSLTDKTIALFGSYGWGDGEWMRNWEERCIKVNAKLIDNPLIINETPDDAGLALCNALGEKLA